VKSAWTNNKEKAQGGNANSNIYAALEGQDE